MSDFNVEAFIKEHTIKIEVFDEPAFIARPDDVRALFARLVPAGHAVVPRDALEKFIATSVPPSSDDSFDRYIESRRQLESRLSPLPASSGPEQTKCFVCTNCEFKGPLTEKVFVLPGMDAMLCPECGEPYLEPATGDFSFITPEWIEKHGDIPSCPHGVMAGHCHDCAKGRAEPQPIAARLSAIPLNAPRDRGEPKCVCEHKEFPVCTGGFTDGHSVNPKYCCTPLNGLVCGHDRACHTPAPAAKEVNNGR